MKNPLGKISKTPGFEKACAFIAERGTFEGINLFSSGRLTGQEDLFRLEIKAFNKGTMLISI